jgi:hypothetical protein
VCMHLVSSCDKLNFFLQSSPHIWIDFRSRRNACVVAKRRTIRPEGTKNCFYTVCVCACVHVCMCVCVYIYIYM